MKKSIKQLCLACIIALMGNIYVNAQNPLWTIPGNYLEFNGEIDMYPLPIPSDADPFDDYTGQAAEYTHNAMPGPNGNPLFFIVDGVVYSLPSESLAEDSEHQLFSLK
jgi:hypothetical protein